MSRIIEIYNCHECKLNAYPPWQDDCLCFVTNKFIQDGIIPDSCPLQTPFEFFETLKKIKEELDGHSKKI